MSKEKTQKTKIVYLELLRIIASFFVIVNHTNSGIFMSRTPGSGTWWASLAYFFMCKTAVPVFLMISGALMLGKVEENQKHVKRFLRILVDLLVFSLLYSAYYHYEAEQQMDFLAALKRIYQVNATNAFWYLYLYLGILLMLPLLQRLSVRMERSAYRYVIGISVVVLGVTPIVAHYNGGIQYNGMFAEPLFSVYVGMLFLGYYLAHEVELKPLYAGISAVVFCGGILLQVVLTYFEYCRNPAEYLFFDDRTFLTVTMTAAALFYLVRYLGSVLHVAWFWNGVAFLGDCAFGIYLFSDFFIDVYEMNYLELMMQMHVLKAVVIYELMVFISGAVITAILKKIPYVNKLM